MSLIKPMVFKANGSVNKILYYSHEALARNVHCRFNQDGPWPHWAGRRLEIKHYYVQIPSTVMFVKLAHTALDLAC
jgi:hypothetical protein